MGGITRRGRFGGGSGAFTLGSTADSARFIVPNPKTDLHRIFEFCTDDWRTDGRTVARRLAARSPSTGFIFGCGARPDRLFPPLSRSRPAPKASSLATRTVPPFWPRPHGQRPSARWRDRDPVGRFANQRSKNLYNARLAPATTDRGYPIRPIRFSLRPPRARVPATSTPPRSPEGAAWCFASA